jgi:hypothetical protein
MEEDVMKIFPDTKKLLPVHRFGFFAAIAIFFVSLCMGPDLVHSEDRLVVKNSSGASTFKVDENGLVYSSDLYVMQGLNPGFWLDETGSGNNGAFFVLDQKLLQIQRRGQNFGSYEASPFYLNIDAPNAAFSIGAGGFVGFGVIADYPLHMASGAYVTSGGVWTNSSSREFKKDIKPLTKDEAHNTLKNLDPVKFSYKADPAEKHVGFIAEDVPDLVATEDRKGMSAMDVVAVLTKVVQDQQKTIEELSRKVAALEKK